MTLARSNPRARQRWGVLAAVLFVLMIFIVGQAIAVHDEGVFELEGNATSGVDAANPANPASKPPGGEDWVNVFNGSSSAVATAFETDLTVLGTLAGAGDSILTGGSTKDIHDLPSWLWKQTTSTSVQDKADIENAFAAQYVVDKSEESCGSFGPTSECALLYFGADRFSNSGDTVMGFWFFKQQIAKSALDAQGNGTFIGQHTPRTVVNGNVIHGDILIVADFRQGGKAPQIQVYEWVSAGGSASTNLDLIGGGTNPASCTQAPPEKPNGPPVPPVNDNDNFCATANQFIVTSPWPYTAKSNSGGTSGTGGATTKFGVATFMEGGINMTALGLGNECFSTFMAESRASHSVTSTLSDFVLGSFGDCESDIATTPQADTGEGFEDIGPDGVSIGTDARLSVRDEAELDISGAENFGGTIDFYLCGPGLDLDAGDNCATDGVKVAEVAVSGSGTYYSDQDGDDTTLTSAGSYCWRAEYSGDPDVGVPGVNDPVDENDTNQSECFTVNPVQPTLTTEAGDDVTLGGDPITDEATLSGTAKRPGDDGVGPDGTINATPESQPAAGGEITWTVYGPDDCTDSELEVTGSPETVSGDDTYGPVEATPTAIGTYYFAAEYDGDSPNTLPVSHNHPDPENEIAGCTDSDQEVTVGGTAALTTAQDWLPNDTATLTGDTNLSGTLTFELYDDGSCGDDEGTVVYDETVEVDNASSGTEFPTSNETFLVTEPGGSYSWLVTYEDDNLEDPDPTCEVTEITIDDTPGD